MSEEISILKTGQCPSLSGRSTLTYQIGRKDQEICLRILENTAGGLFGKEWASLEIVLLALSEPVTSRSLQELFKGKSINTGGFVLAVLLKEGLVKSDGRGYLRNDPAAFMLSVQSLMDSDVSLDATPRPKTAKIVKAKKLIMNTQSDERMTA